MIEAVEMGASRREAAERFDLSPSSVIKWVKRYEETGSVAAKPCGGSTSPLGKHKDWLLALIAEHPDWTLDEIVEAMRKRGSQAAALPFGDSLSAIILHLRRRAFARPSRIATM